MRRSITFHMPKQELLYLNAYIQQSWILSTQALCTVSTFYLLLCPSLFFQPDSYGAPEQQSMVKNWFDFRVRN